MKVFLTIVTMIGVPIGFVGVILLACFGLEKISLCFNKLNKYKWYRILCKIPNMLLNVFIIFFLIIILIGYYQSIYNILWK